MRTISVRDLQQKISKCLQAAQKDKVVVTRHGKPVVLMTGVEGYDWEDLFWATNAAFWKMIQQRRKEDKGIPLEEARKRLEARWKRRKRKKR